MIDTYSVKADADFNWRLLKILHKQILTSNNRNKFISNPKEFTEFI